MDIPTDFLWMIWPSTIGPMFLQQLRTLNASREIDMWAAVHIYKTNQWNDKFPELKQLSALPATYNKRPVAIVAQEKGATHSEKIIIAYTNKTSNDLKVPNDLTAKSKKSPGLTLSSMLKSSAMTEFMQTVDSRSATDSLKKYLEVTDNPGGSRKVKLTELVRERLESKRFASNTQDLLEPYTVRDISTRATVFSYYQICTVYFHYDLCPIFPFFVKNSPAPVAEALQKSKLKVNGTVDQLSEILETENYTWEPELAVVTADNDIPCEVPCYRISDKLYYDYGVYESLQGRTLELIKDFITKSIADSKYLRCRIKTKSDLVCKFLDMILLVRPLITSKSVSKVYRQDHQSMICKVQRNQTFDPSILYTWYPKMFHTIYADTTRTLPVSSNILSENKKVLTRRFPDTPQEGGCGLIYFHVFIEANHQPDGLLDSICHYAKVGMAQEKVVPVMSNPYALSLSFLKRFADEMRDSMQCYNSFTFGTLCSLTIYMIINDIVTSDQRLILEKYVSSNGLIGPIESLSHALLCSDIKVPIVGATGLRKEAFIPLGANLKDMSSLDRLSRLVKVGKIPFFSIMYQDPDNLEQTRSN